jgi:thioredoxin-dependent peroxiredoxin
VTTRLSAGDQLPSVGLRATDGYLLNLRSFVTKQPVVLLFFAGPSVKGAAGATGLAIIQSLVAGYRRLHQAGIAVAAISCDTEEEQSAYASAHNIPFLLLSDARRSAVEMLGIPTAAQRGNVNVARPMVVAVDRDGTIRAVIDRVEPQFLIEQVISVLSEPMPTQPAGDTAAAG